MDFKEYLDLRFSGENLCLKEGLLDIRSQLLSKKLTIKSVIVNGANGNGKTELIKRLIKGTGFDVISLNDAEIKGKVVCFGDLRAYVENNDDFVLFLNFKFLATHKELYDDCFKEIHDVVVLSKKKNILVIFENYDHFTQHFDSIFRFLGLFDASVFLNETPGFEYRKKYLSDLKISIDEDTFSFILNNTNGLEVSEFHSFLLLLKAASLRRLINENLVRGVFKFANISVDDEHIAGLRSIIGRHELKSDLTRIVNLFRRKDELKNMGVNKVFCYLFEGPPGTGKTFAVRCLAKELELKIDHVNMYRIENDGKNESAALNSIFKKSMRRGNRLIFIDEAEKILGKNEITSSDGPLQGELQQIIDGFNEFGRTFNGIIILNVNSLHKFSAPLLDRFKIIHFRTPDDNDRRDYFEKKLELLGESLRNSILDEINLTELVKLTDGDSYRQIDRLWADLVFSKFEGNSISRFLRKNKYAEVTYLG